MSIKIPVVITKEDGWKCGECMFLTTMLFSIRKYGIKEDVGCKLFNENLEVSNGDVFSCDSCPSE